MKKTQSLILTKPGGKICRQKRRRNNTTIC